MTDQPSLYTLAEAADLTGLSTEALRLRIKRGKLASERGNDGQPRVRITDAERQDFARLLVRRQSTLTRQDTVETNAIKVLEAAAAALHERAARAEAEAMALRERAERAEGQAVAERARAEAEAAEREAARIAVARAEGEATALRGQVQAAEVARDAARAELADWTAGGPIGRALRALIYRRRRP